MIGSDKKRQEKKTAKMLVVSFCVKDEATGDAAITLLAKAHNTNRKMTVFIYPFNYSVDKLTTKMNSPEAHASDSSTAPVIVERNEFEFDLLESLDTLQWHLIDVDMEDGDRRAIDGFLEGLLREVVAMTANKKKKTITKVAKKKLQKGFSKLHKKLSQMRRRILKGRIAPFPPCSPPIIPIVVYVPSSSCLPDTAESETTPKAEGPCEESSCGKDESASHPREDEIYYLQDNAYVAKSPSFFLKISGDDKPQHKRSPTLETIRVDSAWDPDLYDSVDDDCFFELDTGIY